jgi:O-antigen ligase
MATPSWRRPFRAEALAGSAGPERRATGGTPAPWSPHQSRRGPSSASNAAPGAATRVAPAAPAVARTSTSDEGRGGAFAFWSFWAFTLVLFVAPQNYIPIPSPGKLSMGLALASHVGARLLNGSLPWRNSWPMGLSVALLLWAIISVPFSLWPGGSVMIIQDQYIKSLAAFWLLASAIDRAERLYLLLWSLCVMSLPIAYHAVSAYDGSARIGGYTSGMASNPNDLALIANVFVPLAVGLFFGTRRLLPRLMFAGLAALNAAAIVLSFSRAGFLALVCNVLLCAHVFLPLGKRLMALCGAVALGAVLLAAMPTYQERLSTIWNVEEDTTGSGQARSKANINAFQLVAQNPIIGSGIGADVLAMNQFAAEWVNVHNVYLQFAVDLGILGLALFIWLFVACLRALARARRIIAGTEHAGWLCPVADGIRISLLVFAVSGAFGPVAYHYYFYYAAGLALAVAHVAATLAARGPQAPAAPAGNGHLPARRPLAVVARPPAWRPSRP